MAHPALTRQQDLAIAAMERVPGRLEQVLTADPAFHQAHVRRVIDELATLVQAICLLAEADWELSQGMETDKPEASALFANRHLLRDYDPLEDPHYLREVTKLAART